MTPTTFRDKALQNAAARLRSIAWTPKRERKGAENMHLARKAGRAEVAAAQYGPRARRFHGTFGDRAR